MAKKSVDKVNHNKPLATYSDIATSTSLSVDDPPEDDIDSLILSKSTSSIHHSYPSESSYTPYSSTSHDSSSTWYHIYPVYFDASRSRSQGRRVPPSLAVHNPLAHTIAQAVAELGLPGKLEAFATHPQDWANPGRVRCCLTSFNSPISITIKNKHHLFIQIAKFLKLHPTDLATPHALIIPGVSLPPPPCSLKNGQKSSGVSVSVPLGWKINSILPLHSPALSAGGVNENLLGSLLHSDLSNSSSTSSSHNDVTTQSAPSTTQSSSQFKKRPKQKHPR